MRYPSKKKKKNTCVGKTDQAAAPRRLGSPPTASFSPSWISTHRLLLVQPPPPSTWAAVLSSQGFVDRHLRLANRCGSPRLFILPEFNSRDTTVHAWSPGSPLAPVLRDDRLRHVSAVTGQCRGLVVLEADRPTTIIRDPNDPDDRVYSYKVNHYVWNPSTGQITALPKANDSFGSWPHHHDNLGIGYDTRIRTTTMISGCTTMVVAGRTTMISGCYVTTRRALGISIAALTWTRHRCQTLS
ncbi:uncharacterized protein [Triticum aestivum]|uniref:uncharacterized protein n=1 Tax=Triticum aestivum TaxID=4565 RepID=UPI001D001B24|nr:uncharacterized protein LOC123084008 [Triticum aestivum]